MRTTFPSFAGFSPRSDARIAFSIAPMTCGVERLRHDQRRLGTESVATWLIGMRVP